MKKKLLVLFTAAMALAAGCKKDDDNSSSGGKQKLVTKVTEIGDETTIYNVSYDSKGRVTSYNSTDGSEKNIFAYDANGNLNKIEYYSENEKTVYDVNYNANGQPTNATAKHYLGDELQSSENLQYTIANNAVVEIKSTDEDDFETVYKLTYQNGNLTMMEGSLGESTTKVTYTFGDKKSPFHFSSVKYVVEFGMSALFFNKNNPTSEKSTFPATESTMAYTFDSDGYPTLIETTSTSVLGSSKTKTTFEYK